MSDDDEPYFLPKWPRFSDCDVRVNQINAIPGPTVLKRKLLMLILSDHGNRCPCKTKSTASLFVVLENLDEMFTGKIGTPEHISSSRAAIEGWTSLLGISDAFGCMFD
jgi:hypothetical protein